MITELIIYSAIVILVWILSILVFIVYDAIINKHMIENSYMFYQPYQFTYKGNTFTIKKQVVYHDAHMDICSVLINEEIAYTTYELSRVWKTARYIHFASNRIEAEIRAIIKAARRDRLNKSIRDSQDNSVKSYFD